MLTEKYIRKEKIEGIEFIFVNRYENTRNGFKHVTNLFVDGYEWQEASCHYINRTWENYAYQTVMLKAISDFMSKIYENRDEIPNEYKWDLSLILDINKLDEYIKQINDLIDKLVSFENHILDSSESLYDFLKLTEKQDRIINKLYVYSKMNLDVDTKNNTNKASKIASFLVLFFIIG